MRTKLSIAKCCCRRGDEPPQPGEPCWQSYGVHPWFHNLPFADEIQSPIDLTHGGRFAVNATTSGQIIGSPEIPVAPPWLRFNVNTAHADYSLEVIDLNPPQVALVDCTECPLSQMGGQVLTGRRQTQGLASITPAALRIDTDGDGIWNTQDPRDLPGWDGQIRTAEQWAMWTQFALSPTGDFGYTDCDIGQFFVPRCYFPLIVVPNSGGVLQFDGHYLFRGPRGGRSNITVGFNGGPGLSPDDDGAPFRSSQGVGLRLQLVEYLPGGSSAVRMDSLIDTWQAWDKSCPGSGPRIFAVSSALLANGDSTEYLSDTEILGRTYHIELSMQLDAEKQLISMGAIAPGFGSFSSQMPDSGIYVSPNCTFLARLYATGSSESKFNNGVNECLLSNDIGPAGNLPGSVTPEHALSGYSIGISNFEIAAT